MVVPFGKNIQKPCCAAVRQFNFISTSYFIFYHIAPLNTSLRVGISEKKRHNKEKRHTNIYPVRNMRHVSRRGNNIIKIPISERKCKYAVFR